MKGKHAGTVTFGALLFILFFALMQVGLAEPWLTGFDYRKSHVILSASGAGTGYPVQLTTYYNTTGNYNFGNTTLGGTSVSIENLIRACNFTTTYGGNATQIIAGLDSDTANAKVQCGLYFAVNNSLIESTNEVTVTGGAAKAWHTFTFNNTVILAPNTEYYLCAWSESVAGQVSLWCGSGGIAIYFDPETYPGWPSSLSFGPGYLSYLGSIYIPVTVTEDYQDRVNLNEHCQSNFNDVRFTESDGITELHHWGETGTAWVNATWWIRISENLSSDNVTIYVYYGNATCGASSYRSGPQTFDFFDDFNDASLNLTLWTELQAGGSYTEGSGYLRVRGAAAGAIEQISGNIAVGPGHAVESDFRMSETNNQHIGLRQRTADPNRDHATFKFAGATKYYRTINDTGTQDTVRTTTLTSWTRSYIQWISSQVVFYDGNTATHTTRVPADDCPIEFLARNNVNTIIDIDWILIRNFVDPEPAHGEWGSEETVP